MYRNKLYSLFPVRLVVVFILLTAGLIILGSKYYNNQKNNFRKDSENLLNSVSGLKVKQIQNWRYERIGDGQVIASNKFIGNALSGLVKNPYDKKIMLDVREWMKSMISTFFYRSIELVNSDGNISIGEPFITDISGPFLKETIKKVIHDKQVILSDFHFIEGTDSIHINLYVPIVKSDNTVSEVLILEINPYDYLYPFIQTWPAPSRSAETLLFEKQGDSVVYLNELRHKQNTALKFKISVNEKQIMAVKAVNGESGFREGMDYRGKEVLASINKIEGTNWYLISKIDKDEVFENLYEISKLVYTLVSSLILLSAIGIILYWRHQRVRHYKELLTSEQEKKALAEHFDYLVKYANDIILLTDENGKFYEANEKAFQTYGYTKEEFLKLNVKDIRANKYKYSTESDYTKIKQEKGYTFEIYHVKKDGTEFPVEISSRVITIEGKDFFQGIIRDITERKKAILEIELSQQKFKAVFNNANDAIMLLEGNKFILINSQAEKMFGASADEILNRTPADFSPEFQDDGKTSREKVKKKNALALAGEPQRFEWIHKRKNGELFYSEVSLNAMELEGRNYLLGIVRDISENKTHELELMEAKEKAEEASKLKSYFLANMSHELRTPMTAILGFAEVLKDDLEPGDFRDMATVIHKGGMRLMNTLNSILDLSRVEANKLDVKIEDCDLTAVVLSITKMFSAYAKEKEIELKVNASEKVFASIDLRLMEQVLNNLIQNAITYTNKGYVEVSVYNKEKNLRSYAVVKVTDTGIGIEKNMQTLVFEPFRQASEGISRKFEGTGLGLTITKKFVELMDGTIKLESEPGKGSTFTVILPAADDIITAAEDIPSEQEFQMRKGRLPKILIVEDDPDNIYTTTVFLKGRYELDSTDNGEEAILMAEAKRYDAILMDIGLKGINGMETAQKIRLINGYEKTPIIALTAYAMNGDKEWFLEHSCSHYIPKPFTRKSLIKVLESVC